MVRTALSVAGVIKAVVGGHGLGCKKVESCHLNAVYDDCPDGAEEQLLTWHPNRGVGGAAPWTGAPGSRS